MDPKFVALVRYDFCSEAKHEDILNTLSKVYGSDGDEYGGATFSGGSWSHVIFGDEPEFGQDMPDFEFVRTIVNQRVRHVVDVTTVAMLTEQQMQKIAEYEERRASPFLADLLESLQQVSERIPTVVKTTPDSNPSIVYVEPEERIKPEYEDGVPIPESVYANGINRDLLTNYHLTLVGNSTYWGEDIVNSWTVAQRLGRLAVLNLSSTHNDVNDDWITGPVWLRRLDRLRPYLRAYHWLNHRLDEIAEFSTDTHGVEKPTQSYGDTGIESLLEEQQDLGALREDWTDFFTRTYDEIEELRNQFGPRGIEELEESNATTLPNPENAPIGFLEEPLPIDDYYRENVEILFDRLENSLQRVGEKQEQISNLVHDQIQVKATQSNLELQKSIQWLTKMLLVLTIVLIIVELGPTFVSAL